MKVAIAGSSGLIGQALVRRLAGGDDAVRRLAGGDDAVRRLAGAPEVVRLVRRPPKGSGERRWDPVGGLIDAPGLDDVDAVVNLCGAGIADRPWTPARRRVLRTSRIEPTRFLASAMAAQNRPMTLLSGSAVGYYGDTGDAVVNEAAAPGQGFLADLVGAWEEATEPAANAGVRVVCLRTGLVLAKQGGLLGKLLPVFKLGLGGRLGDGSQWMPWIAIDDHIGAIAYLLDSTTVSGPINLSAPNPVTNAEFTAALGAAVRRPTLLPTPMPLLRIGLGNDMVNEALLVSNKVVPELLVDLGYTFAHPELDEALSTIVR